MFPPKSSLVSVDSAFRLVSCSNDYSHLECMIFYQITSQGKFHFQICAKAVLESLDFIHIGYWSQSDFAATSAIFNDYLRLLSSFCVYAITPFSFDILRAWVLWLKRKLSKFRPICQCLITEQPYNNLQASLQRHKEIL